MRPIKFRGLRLDNKEWIYGYYLEIAAMHQTFGEHYILPENEEFTLFLASGVSGLARDGQLIEVDPATVGEFTGLLDKNGKEIYEGDIVKFSNNNGKDWKTAIIEFQEHCYNAGFYPNKPTNAACYWAVIGNIHQNPELLEEK